MDLLWILLAALAGGCIAVQAAANGSLRANLGDPRWATFFSICGTALTAVLMMALSQPKVPSSAAFLRAPWWNWIGGPLGACIVLAGAALTPRLGAAAFIASVVAGQLFCSVVLDSCGLMNIVAQPLSLARVTGVLLVFGGVLLVRYG